MLVLVSISMVERGESGWRGKRGEGRDWGSVGAKNSIESPCSHPPQHLVTSRCQLFDNANKLRATLEHVICADGVPVSAKVP